MALPSGPQVQPGPDGFYTVTLIPAHNPGPHVFTSLKTIFKAANVPITWDEISTPSSLSTTDEASSHLTSITTSLKRTKLGIKGSFITSPHLGAPRSLNVTLRKDLDLFAAVTPVHNLPGLKTRHQDIDFHLIRENIEGEYVGLEHAVIPGVAAESIKLASSAQSKRVIDFAYQFARVNHRRKLTVIHKANIMKRADGMFRDLFLEYGEKCRAQGEDFETNDMIIDNASMQTVIRPQRFDVVVTSNLYGSILASIGAGLVGGNGVLPGVEVGSECLVFGMGLRGIGMEKFEEQDWEWANPTAILFAGVLLLRYLGLEGKAKVIEDAVWRTITERKVLTRDLGGKASCQEFTEAVLCGWNGDATFKGGRD